MDEAKLNEFTGRLADEVIDGSEGVGDSISRRELIRILRPVAKRFTNLNARVDVLEDKHENRGRPVIVESRRKVRWSWLRGR